MYGLRTKADRLKYQEYQFEQLEKKGYKKETYKDLVIFTQYDVKNSCYFIKIYRGTSTNEICYYRYRAPERMAETIASYKKSADAREQRKAEEKSKPKIKTGAAACAAAIRKELKSAFPGFKFSVRSDTFSGGDSVHISWTDGPISEQVTKITYKYQDGHFDSMQDMYIYSKNRGDLPGAKYVQERRDQSDETRAKLDEFTQKMLDNDTNNNWRGNRWEVERMLTCPLFSKTSFPVDGKIKEIAKTEKTDGSWDDFFKIVFEGEETPEPTPDPEKDESKKLFKPSEILAELEKMEQAEPAQPENKAAAPVIESDEKPLFVAYKKDDYSPEELDEKEAKKQAKIEAWEERQQTRADRFRDLADKNRKKSEQAYKTAKQIGDFIPMGQPILVGHHSEGRHRRDLAKIDNNMRTSIEADKKADYYEQKAKAAENSNVISSDDPQAIDKLREKLEGLEKLQKIMVETNKIIRKKGLSDVEKVEAMQKIGLSEKNALEIMQPDFMGRVGFAPYQLSNNNQNISTVKKRIKYLERHEDDEKTEIEVNGALIVDDPDDNRVKVFFDSIPPEETRKALKSNGFRWSPKNKAWQSYRNSYQLDRAKRILSE